MPNLYLKIDKKRYREEFGFYYEDFKVGDIFEHRPGRTITEIDNIWQSLLFMNKHPIHIDEHYAKKTDFKKNLVNSVVTFCIVNGMTVTTMSFKAVANLGWDKVRLPNPVYVGDTLYAESKILEKRKSKSKPSYGIVKIHTSGYKHDKTLILECERTFLVPKRHHNIDYGI